jgi:NAD(P)-dependent dehydrogenase (short-subunit alcohol dehydrogenase family)
MRLDGKKALVTGAGSYGIGRAIALAFAREGADVAIHYHSRPDVAASVVADIEALDRASFSLQADLSEPGPCRQMVRAASERLGGLDVIVTAAAAIYRRPILATTSGTT